MTPMRSIRHRTFPTVPKCLAVLAGVAMALSLAGCGRAAPPASAARTRNSLTAFVSILPVADFVRRIGGERVKVSVLVEKGQSHETFEVTPRQVASLSQADVYFTVGLPLEKSLVDKLVVNSPSLFIEDVSRSIRRMPTVDCHHEGEGHPPGAGHEAEHAVDSGDFHTWLSPRNARLMCQSIRDTLIKLDPGHRAEYEKNCAAYLAELDRLDARLTAVLKPIAGGTVLVYHPAFGYFCRDYGLVQKSVESEGKEPSAAQLARLVNEAKTANVRVVFVQPQFAAKSAESLAASVGAVVVPMDPLPAAYILALDEMASTIRKELSAPTGK